MGYEVGWGVVKKVLIEGGLNSGGVVEEGGGFVVWRWVREWYGVYEVNGYMKDGEGVGDIYWGLDEKIEDG